MGSLTEYFQLNCYRPKYTIGDWVFGRYHSIPFAGSVGNDTVINHTEGPRVSVHLHLPIRHEGVTKSVIIVQHKDIKPMKEIK